MSIVSFFRREWSLTARRPSRVLNLFRPGKLKAYLDFQKLRQLSRESWARSDHRTATRQVGSYEEYVRLQQSKLQYLDLSSHEARFRSALRGRLDELGVVERNWRVLCLGARLGAEVAAFRDLGCFAVGVDLNPGRDNPWVLYGDFHRLEYPDGCVDAIYSNSLDHCFELGKVLAEVHRLVRTDGFFVVEADPGAKDEDGVEPDLWATFQWETVDGLRRSIEEAGFIFVSSDRFAYPRHGTRLLFRKG